MKKILALFLSLLFLLSLSACQTELPDEKPLESMSQEATNEIFNTSANEPVNALQSQEGTTTPQGGSGFPYSKYTELAIGFPASFTQLMIQKSNREDVYNWFQTDSIFKKADGSEVQAAVQRYHITWEEYAAAVVDKPTPKSDPDDPYFFSEEKARALYYNDRKEINRLLINKGHAFYNEADGGAYDLFDLSDMTVEEAKQKGITADEMKPLLDSWNLLSGSKQEKDGWLQIGNEGKVNAEHIRELFRQLKTA